jgi:hypothetical protein
MRDGGTGSVNDKRHTAPYTLIATLLSRECIATHKRTTIFCSKLVACWPWLVGKFLAKKITF